MNVTRKISFLIVLAITALLANSCRPYGKEVPTGTPFPANNVYSSVSYDHASLQNVFLLPFENPFNNRIVNDKKIELAQSLLRNFSKFHYFHIKYDNKYPENSEKVIDLSTGQNDRFKIGALAQEYNAQAVMKISIDEYQPYFPMRMRVKAIMVDGSSGERIWAFDETFDTDDANVVNGMRYWWNKKMAGGFNSNRFSLSRVRAEFFTNYIFDTMADSYGRARVRNVEMIQNQRLLEAKKAEEIRLKQEQVYE
ncbi:MAG: hypothetical protein ACI9S8_001589 [Chlamydiales bacterium]|jgi:hypothetical protein